MNEQTLPGLATIKDKFAKIEGADAVFALIEQQAAQLVGVEQTVAEVEDQSHDVLANIIKTNPGLWEQAIAETFKALNGGRRSATTAGKLAILEKIGAEVPNMLLASQKSELFAPKKEVGVGKKESRAEIRDDLRQKFAEYIIQTISAQIINVGEPISHQKISEVLAKQIAEVMNKFSIMPGETVFFDDIRDPNTDRGALMIRKLHQELAQRQLKVAFDTVPAETDQPVAKRPEMNSEAYRRYVEGELEQFAQNLAKTVGPVAEQYAVFMQLLLNNAGNGRRFDENSFETSVLEVKQMIMEMTRGQFSIDRYETLLQKLDPKRRTVVLDTLVGLHREQPSNELAEILLLFHEPELGEKPSVIADIQDRLKVRDAAELRTRLESKRFGEARQAANAKIDKINFLAQRDGYVFDYSHAERLLLGEQTSVAADLARQEIATSVLKQKIEDLIAENPKKYSREVVQQFTQSLDTVRSTQFGANQKTEARLDPAGELTFLAKFVNLVISADPSPYSSEQFIQVFQQAEQLGIDPNHLLDIHNEIALAVGKYNEEFTNLFASRPDLSKPTIQFRDHIGTLFTDGRFTGKLWRLKVREDVKDVFVKLPGYQNFKGVGLYAWGETVGSSASAAKFIEEGVDEITDKRMAASATLEMTQVGLEVAQVEQSIKLSEKAIGFGRYEQARGELSNDAFVKNTTETAAAAFEKNIAALKMFGEQVRKNNQFGMDVLNDAYTWESRPDTQPQGFQIYNGPKADLERRMRDIVSDGGIKKSYKLESGRRYEYTRSDTFAEFKADLEIVRAQKQAETAKQIQKQLELIAKGVKTQDQILTELLAHGHVLDEAAVGKLHLPVNAGNGSTSTMESVVPVRDILASYGEHPALETLYRQFSSAVTGYSTTIDRAVADVFYSFTNDLEGNSKNVVVAAREKLREALGYSKQGYSAQVNQELLTAKLQPAFEAGRKQLVIGIKPTEITLPDDVSVPGRASTDLKAALSTKVADLEKRQAQLLGSDDEIKAGNT